MFKHTLFCKHMDLALLWNSQSLQAHLLVGKSADGRKLFLVNMFMAIGTPPLLTKLNWNSNASSDVVSTAGMSRLYAT